MDCDIFDGAFGDQLLAAFITYLRPRRVRIYRGKMGFSKEKKTKEIQSHRGRQAGS